MTISNTFSHKKDFAADRASPEKEKLLRGLGMLKQSSVLLLGGYSGISFRGLSPHRGSEFYERESAKNLRKSLSGRAPELQSLTVMEIKALVPALLEKLENDRAALSISKNLKREGSRVVKITYFGPEKELKKLVNNKVKAKLSKRLAQAYGEDQVQISLKGQETLAKELAIAEDLDEDEEESCSALEDNQPKGHRRRISELLIEKHHELSPLKLKREKSTQTKVAPSFCNTVYDSVRADIQDILAVSTKFRLVDDHKTKGVMLVCGDINKPAKPHVPSGSEDKVESRDDDSRGSSKDSNMTEDGYGPTLLPLKAPQGTGLLVDNPLIAVLAKYARLHQESSFESSECPKPQEQLPELILGLCVNNWGMYGGRHALIEALLELMGPLQGHKLSIHTAAYAKYFNTDVLRDLLPSADFDVEESIRLFHADAFEDTALAHKIGFDTVQIDHCLFGDDVTKAAVVEELSNATMEAVKRTPHTQLCKLVLEVLENRRLLQENIKTKGFRRRPIQNKIKESSTKMLDILVANFGSPSIVHAIKIPGWDNYVESQGGVAIAVMAFFCHSLDVLAGSVGRSDAQISMELASNLVEATATPSNRMMEYCFNQLYELTPVPEKPRIYIYRGLEDLRLFSTMTCGVVDMGGKV